MILRTVAVALSVWAGLTACGRAEETPKPDAPPQQQAAGSPMVEYLDNVDDQFQFKAYLPIQPGARGNYGKEVLLGETPAGNALKYVHQGSYEDLEDVYSRIEDQLSADQKEMKRVVEEYVSDPQSTSPDQMLTNIYVFTE